MDEPLTETRSGTTSHYEQDGLGSVTSLTNAAGALANTYTYDSFGKLTASTGTVVNPFRYTTREFDPETGNYFYRARYYDAGTGRFLTEDPLRFLAGYNFYQYATGNPISFLDPFGLCIVDVFFNPVIRGGRTWGYHAYIVVTDNIQRSKYPVTEAGWPTHSRSLRMSGVTMLLAALVSVRPSQISPAEPR